MSTFYLIDAHTNPVGNSQINEVVSDTFPGQVRCDGNFVVRIPDGVKVVNPTNLSDLLTQKYAGILAQYPGFTSIVYDDLLDSTAMIPPAGNGSTTKRGERGTFGYSYTGGFVTTMVDVSPTVISQAIVVFEIFKYVLTDSKTGGATRYYRELSTLDTPWRLSVNNNVDTQVVTYSGQLVTFAPSEQGSEVVLKNVTGTTGDPFYQVGSWAVIY